GSDVDFLVGGRGGCARVEWSTTRGALRRTAASCVSRQLDSNAGGGVSAPVLVDRRGRPVLVADHHRLLLPAFARSAIVNRGVALVDATRPDAGVFAVRLSDGVFTF